MFQAIIIDDEKLFLDYLSGWSRWKEYDICIRKTFTSSQLALDYLESGPDVDIILTDIKMPGMNGIELMERIPARYKKHAYIVALSGYEEYALVRQAFLNGASDYILKVDVNMPEFEKAIARGADYLRKARSSGETENQTGSVQLIESIKEYVDGNLSQDLSLNSLAAHFRFSPGYLSQIFSQKAGQTVMDYVIGKRIELSQTLLSITSKSITDVAYDAGFNSPEHFSRTFRRITGMSPREYRNSLDKPFD